jgi:hypothetical protein
VERAKALWTALQTASDSDMAFAADLNAWWRQAQEVPLGGATNVISGGVQLGTVVQGQNFYGPIGGSPQPFESRNQGMHGSP